MFAVVAAAYLNPYGPTFWDFRMVYTAEAVEPDVGKNAVISTHGMVKLRRNSRYAANTPMHRASLFCRGLVWRPI